jgi:hypothetical protein
MARQLRTAASLFAIGVMTVGTLNVGVIGAASAAPVVHDVQFFNSDAVLGSFSEIDGCLATDVVVIGGDLAFKQGTGAPDPRQDFVTLIVLQTDLCTGTQVAEFGNANAVNGDPIDVQVSNVAGARIVGSILMVDLNNGQTRVIDVDLTFKATERQKPEPHTQHFNIAFPIGGRVVFHSVDAAALGTVSGVVAPQETGENLVEGMVGSATLQANASGALIIDIG